MRKRLVIMVVIAAAVVGVLSPAALAGSARAPYCGIRWGSLPKDSSPMTTGPITSVRAGRHACFDRLVVDLAAPVTAAPGPQAPGFHVEYVAQVTEDGSGDPVPLAGGAFLQIGLHANAYNAVTGETTYAPADRSHIVNVAGYRTFRQVAFGGGFEGFTTIGLGLRARLPFRVFVLSGPGTGSRVVIDVAHRW